MQRRPFKLVCAVYTSFTFRVGKLCSRVDRCSITDKCSVDLSLESVTVAGNDKQRRSILRASCGWFGTQFYVTLNGQGK